MGNTAYWPLFSTPENKVFAHEQVSAPKYPILIAHVVIFFFFLYMVVLARKNGMVSLSLHHNSFVHRLLNRFFPPLIALLLLSPFFFLPYINIIRYTYSYRPCFLFILCVFHIFFKFSFSFLCRFAELFYLCTRKTGTTSCTDGGGTVTLKKKEFFERFS